MVQRLPGIPRIDQHVVIDDLKDLGFDKMGLDERDGRTLVALQQ